MDIFCMFLRKSEESQHSLFVTVCEYHLRGSCPRSVYLRVCVCVECEHMCPCITGSMWSFLEMILSNLMNIWARRYFSFSSVTLFFLCWGVLPSSLTSTHNKALMIHTFLFCALGSLSLWQKDASHELIVSIRNCYVLMAAMRCSRLIWGAHQ